MNQKSECSVCGWCHYDDQFKLHSLHIHTTVILTRRTGTSLTFVSRSDWSKAHDLIPILVEAQQVG